MTFLKRQAARIKPKLGKGVTVTVSDDGKTMTLRTHYVDGGNKWMTYADVAAYCNVDIKTVQYWNRARTKAAARFPFPETREFAGPRVRRTELIEWWKKMTGDAGETPFYNRRPAEIWLQRRKNGRKN